MHAHVGFLAQRQIHLEYADGRALEFAAPDVVVIEPGHDAWVVSQQPAALIDFDFERETKTRLGMRSRHAHAASIRPPRRYSDLLRQKMNQRISTRVRYQQ
jgi:hypothetical protein